MSLRHGGTTLDRVGARPLGEPRSSDLVIIRALHISADPSYLQYRCARKSHPRATKIYNSVGICSVPLSPLPLRSENSKCFRTLRFVLNSGISPGKPADLCAPCAERDDHDSNKLSRSFLSLSSLSLWLLYFKVGSGWAASTCSLPLSPGLGIAPRNKR